MLTLNTWDARIPNKHVLIFRSHFQLDKNEQAIPNVWSPNVVTIEFSLS